MKTGIAGLKIIMRFEGFRSGPYKCPAGKWTIGYGHTGGVDQYHPPVSKKISEQLLLEDISDTEAFVDKLVKVELNQNQFDSLVSFGFNVGPYNFARSTLLKRLNAGDYEAAANQLLRWIRAGGKILSGLIKRRIAERNLFLGRTKC